MAPPLPASKREQIITLWRSGYRNADICKKLNTTKRTVYFWLRRFEKEGALIQHKRQTYSRATTAAQDNEIIEAHSSNPYKNTNATASKYNVSMMTVRRRLREAGLEIRTGKKVRRQLKKKPNTEHGDSRIAWLREDSKNSVKKKKSAALKISSTNSCPSRAKRGRKQKESTISTDTDTDSWNPSTSEVESGELFREKVEVSSVQLVSVTNVTKKDANDANAVDKLDNPTYGSKDNLDNPICTEGDLDDPIFAEDDLDEAISAKDDLENPISGENDLDDPICSKDALDYPICAQDDLDDPISPKDALDNHICAEDDLDYPICSKDALNDPMCPEHDLDDPMCPEHDLDDPICPKNALDHTICAEDDLGDLIRVKNDLGGPICAKDDLDNTIRVKDDDTMDYQIPAVKDKDKEIGQIPNHWYCKGCSNTITGFRYICVSCPDVELCVSCEATGLHALHYVLRVPKRRPAEEITAVLEKIREELVKHKMAIESIKPEVKEEPDLLEVPEKIHMNGSQLMSLPVYHENQMEHKQNSNDNSVINACVNTQSDSALWVTEDVLDVPDIKEEYEIGEETITSMSVPKDVDRSSSESLKIIPLSNFYVSGMDSMGNLSAATGSSKVMVISPWPPMRVPEVPSVVIPDAPQTRLAVIPGKYVLEISGLATTRKENMLPED